MPNWCYNTLIISGQAKEVEKFILDNQGGEGEPLLFSKSVPEPTYKHYTDSSSKTNPGGPPDWYQWRVTNWGTKWEPNSHRLIEVETIKIDNKELKTATYYFDTAWGPAGSWFEKVITQYKNLKFCLTYSEEAEEFRGSLIAINGEITSHLEDE